MFICPRLSLCLTHEFSKWTFIRIQMHMYIANHSLTHSLTHSTTHPLTHLPTHSPILWLISINLSRTSEQHSWIWRSINQTSLYHYQISALACLHGVLSFISPHYFRGHTDYITYHVHKRGCKISNITSTGSNRLLRQWHATTRQYAVS